MDRQDQPEGRALALAGHGVDLAAVELKQLTADERARAQAALHTAVFRRWERDGPGCPQDSCGVLRMSIP